MPNKFTPAKKRRNVPKFTNAKKRKTKQQRPANLKTRTGKNQKAKEATKVLHEVPKLLESSNDIKNTPTKVATSVLDEVLESYESKEDHTKVATSVLDEVLECDQSEEDPTKVATNVLDEVLESDESEEASFLAAYLLVFGNNGIDTANAMWRDNSPGFVSDSEEDDVNKKIPATEFDDEMQNFLCNGDGE